MTLDIFLRPSTFYKQTLDLLPSTISQTLFKTSHDLQASFKEGDKWFRSSEPIIYRAAII